MISLNLLILLQTFVVYLAPIAVGTIVAKKYSWRDIPYYFARGALLFFALALLVQYVGVTIWSWNFATVFFPLVHSLIVLSTGKLAWQWARNKFAIDWRGLGVIVGMLTLAAMSYAIWTYRSPYTLNWDWFQHQTMSRLLQSGHFSFFTSQLSDTFGFNSYPPFLHTLIAIAQYPSRLTPEYVTTFWQYIGFWHLTSVGLVAWTLGWIIAKKPLLAWLTAIVAIFTFDPVMSFTSYFFLPQTVAAVLTVGLLPKVFHTLRGREVVLMMLGLVLMHYMIGVAGALILLGIWLYRLITRSHLGVARLLSVIAIVGALSLFWYMTTPNTYLLSLNQGEAQQYVYSFAEKILAIERTYGYMAYILVPIGVLWIVLKRTVSSALMLFFLLALLLVVFMPIPYIWKLFTILRFLIGIVMAIGLHALLSNIRNRMGRVIALLLVFGGLVVNLILNNMYWKDGISVSQEFRHISNDDIAAATELYRRYDSERILLISDPSTQFVLEGMSGIDTVGGAYMNLETRTKLVEVLDSPNPEDWKDFVVTLRDRVVGKPTQYLVAISGRTFVWSSASLQDRQSFSYNVWSPKYLSKIQIEYLDRLTMVSGVQRIYTSPSLYLFVVEAK